MASLETFGVTHQNREIITYATRSYPLSELQLAQLEAFSMLDDEWRTLLAAGERYAGTDARMSEVDGQRNEQLSSNLDPVLAGAIHEYLKLIEVAQFENEP